MYHFPKFFNHTSKVKRSKGPRLQRLNAQKGINYSPSHDLTTRSLDIDTTSFRIEGIEGELDRVYLSLGLSGPDDFAIPVADWEARKMHTRCLSNGSQTLEVNSLELGGCSGVVCDLGDKFNDIVRVSSDVDDKIQQVVSGGGGVRRGINGVRPPVLMPPPNSMPYTIPQYDLKPFVQEGRGGLSSDEDDGENELFCENEGVEISESCSFTTNDDDSSSTTTENISPTVRTRSVDSSSVRNEPPSYISPNGGVRRIVNNWTKGKLLGRGSFGMVYEGIADGGFFLAVKEVSLLDQGVQGRQSIYQLEQEISLLSKFEHENIVQYYGTYKDESTLYIFLELASKGSLYNLYQQYHLRDAPVSAYTRQILLGLKYLHDRDVVHRDIKCANILVDTNGTVKLADFGLAKALNDVQSCKGTAFWMAPEVVKRSEGYGLAADIWSLGCTVLEMLTGQLPYYPLECMQAVYKIGNSVPPHVPDSLSKDARDFILQCLQVMPSSRPTAAQLLDHPFVKGRLLSSSELESPHNPLRQA